MQTFTHVAMSGNAAGHPRCAARSAAGLGAAGFTLRDSASGRTARDGSVAWLTGAFETIDLAQLNAKAEMLQRQDIKYIVAEADLRRAVVELTRHFDVLEIDGKRVFTYETCYFDDVRRSQYFDHLRDQRERCKVRTRLYADAGLCFVEIKLRGDAGATIKRRLACPPAMHGTLDDKALEHIRSAYRKLYGRDFAPALEPAVNMHYQRITLVAKRGGERMTIDTGMVFSSGSASRTVDAGVFVVETKSANADGIADRILLGLQQRPAASCTKYCVALAALGDVTEYGKFLPALRELGLAPPSAGPGLVGAMESRTAPATWPAGGGTA